MVGRHLWVQIWRRLARLIWLLVLASSLGGSTRVFREPADYVRGYTRDQEFDFLTWTADALELKFAQFGLGAANYLDESTRQALVIEYFDLVSRAQELGQRLIEVYADPNRVNQDAVAAGFAAELSEVRNRLAKVQPLAESVLQDRVAAVLDNLGLGLGGAIFPPVAFHFTPSPMALIVSPREVIRQDANVQLAPELSLEDQRELEARVEGGLDVSALVVPIGGIGIYPTMVMESSAPSWVTEVIVHEWVHNYLTLRPLGLNYETSPELRTMNETVASLLGKEIGRRVLERYFPAYVPPPPAEGAPSAPENPPTFDFRAEMRVTRVRVDELLAEGRIEEAEAYMEARRQVFWEHGYHSIRRLNQAYFAFYGAYADEPGGAAGEDPVGEAVRELWARIQAPAAFLRVMAWMDDFADLEEALGE